MVDFKMASLANKIARGIFEVGEEYKMNPTRIEFKGKDKLNGLEVGLGGLDEHSLATVIRGILKEEFDSGS